MSAPRRPTIVLAACGVGAVVVAAATVALAAGARTPVVDLAEIVEAWPDAYTVVGTKSEPLFTERIRLTRDGDDFRAVIEVLGQGDAAFGTQRSAVRVGSDGTLTWVEGCGKPAAQCADDPALRGFLSTAALVALHRDGRLPDAATARTLHGTDVVCVDDAALHPDAEPALVPLEACFDRETGATLGSWSAHSEAFVAATLAAGFSVNVPS